MSFRTLHRWVGLTAGVLGLFMAITGIMMSVDPAAEALQAGTLGAGPGISAAQLAGSITSQIKGVQEIRKSANNSVTVQYSTGAGTGQMGFDPYRLKPIPAAPRSGFWSFIKEAHRSLFLGNAGRAIAGAAAAAMIILSLTGVSVMVRRMGGWGALLRSPHRHGARALHLDAGRLALVFLMLLSVTGIYMTLASFEVVPTKFTAPPAFPAVDATRARLPVAQVSALADIPFSALRDLVMPYPDDPTDVYTVTTDAGTGYIDPTTGKMAGFTQNGLGARIYQWVYLLHTGQGAWWLGIILGLGMLLVPALVVSGFLMAIRRPANPMRGIKTASAHFADTVILVGSEGKTTWGFAGTLAKALIAAGHKVHAAPMNALAHSYPHARHILVLTSTYGQGEAPSTASGFFKRLERFRSLHVPFTVLGFGDKSFRDFCKFAEDAEQAMLARGMHTFMERFSIDRASEQAFSGWGAALRQHFAGLPDLEHHPKRPKTTKVRLNAAESYGQEVQAPVSVLRFGASGRKLPRHEPGDLLGVYVPQSRVPRFYSLASSSRDGVLEICVRKQLGGLCSSHLAAMRPGDKVEVFVKKNPGFKPRKGKSPLILIGAGAGIGPLMGFTRANRQKRPVHLFWGGRDPGSDFLYRDDIDEMRDRGQLSGVHTIFSRVPGGGYVQKRLLERSDEICALVRAGAQILVCGGIQMGSEVRDAIDAALQPAGLSVARLRKDHRYLEDVY